MNMTTDCVFCKIASGEIPGDILYQDKDVIAFPDINPAAPTHLLVISRKHIPTLVQLTEDDTTLIGKMTLVANRLAREQGMAESGYRLVINCGPDAGQLVPHLHMHLLGGRKLRWEY
ncbi:histidine triad nucleotide-binding protein [Chloroflexota bacterium]